MQKHCLPRPHLLFAFRSDYPAGNRKITQWIIGLTSVSFVVSVATTAYGAALVGLVTLFVFCPAACAPPRDNKILVIVGSVLAMITTALQFVIAVSIFVDSHNGFITLYRLYCSEGFHYQEYYSEYDQVYSYSYWYQDNYSTCVVPIGICALFGSFLWLAVGMLGTILAVQTCRKASSLDKAEQIDEEANGEDTDEKENDDEEEADQVES